MKNVRNSGSVMVWLNIALIVVIGLALFLFMRSSSKRGETLARVGEQKLYRAGLDASAEQKIRSLEFAKYGILESSVNRWIENIVLSKEATRRSKSVEELATEEIWNKINVTPKDVLLRYAQSPDADSLEYDRALKEINKVMRQELYEAKKSEFVASLAKTYDVRNFMKAPQGYAEAAVVSTFPVFKVHPARPDVVNGRVVAPPYLGSANAPVLLEIYSDFMCPYSAKFSQTAREAAKNYPDKLRIEFHHYPLDFHKSSDLQSQAATCAQEQGKFWEYHDALFAKQGQKDIKALEDIADSLGLEKKGFASCLETARYQVHVASDLMEGTKRGAQGTPSYFINGRFSNGAMPFEVIKKYIDWFLSPNGAYPGIRTIKPAAGAKQQAPADQPDQVFTEADLKGSPVMGAADAPVTLIEFIDFHCPFCKKGADTIDAVVAGRKDIRFVSKQYPLSFHEGADLAAVAALCAHEQGKYWEYRKQLFSNYWGKQQVPDLKSAAKDVGLDQGKFDACFDGAKTKPQVDADTKFGASKGVQGTPAYFINGKSVFGALPAENFTKIIEDKKAAKKK